MFSSKDLFFTPAATTGYQIAKSLRFRSSASAYLSRTPASSTSSTIWTLSCWVKRGAISQSAPIDNKLIDANGNTRIYFGSTDQLFFDSGGASRIITNPVYRDPSSWYHVVFSCNTVTGTQTFYVNGVQVTSLATNAPLTGSATTSINTNTAHLIGKNGAAAYYADFYLADYYLIDGQALTPSSFGENNSTTGVWQPKAYTGTYGTNGFYLKFTDVGATSGSNTGYGKDFAGTNYWTTNNFGTTSTATTYDSMTDSPTSYSSSVSNYSVLNPLKIGSAVTVSDGNLKSAATTTTWNTQTGTVYASSGKWYAEVTVGTTNGSTTRVGVGVATNPVAQGNYLGSDAYGWAYFDLGTKYNNGSSSSYGATYTTGNVIGIALDLDGGTLTFYKDGASQGTAYSTGISGTFTIAVTQYGSGAGSTINFGQQPFAQTVPSGYSALNTYNLPTPTIANGASYMAAVTYIGDSTNSRTITTSSSNSGNNPLGTTFQPDFIWSKSRTNPATGYYNILIDSVRGAASGFYKTLYSNSTDSENTYLGSTYGGISDLTTSGFSLANAGSNYWLNQNTYSYIAWQWNAGGAPTTDNVAGAGNVPTAGSVKINGSNSTSTLAGSIAATRISANTSAGFSVVTYTGNGTAGATIGHGLGVAPDFIFGKERNVAGDSWPVYHKSLSSAGYLILNSTGAAATSATIWGNDTSGVAPTSSVFTVGSNSAINQSTSTFVMYCFAPVAGYSAFGSYTGNSSSDGVFIFTGFRPRFILIKNTTYTSGTDWYIFDTSRNTYNVSNSYLNSNLSAAEATGGDIDILSNGFKLRHSSTALNNSSYSYIYMAVAENPFKFSLGR